MTNNNTAWINRLRHPSTGLLLGLLPLAGCPETDPGVDAAALVDAGTSPDAPTEDAASTPDADAFEGPDARTYGDAPFTPGECLPVTPVGSSLMLTGQNYDLAMPRDFGDLSCGGNTGPAVYYSVEVGPRQRFEAVLNGDSFLDSLVLIDSCDAMYCRDTASSGETLRYTNPSATTQSFLLAASRFRVDELPYDFSARVIDVAPGQVCTLPIAVTSGARLTDQNVAFGADLPDFSCGFSFDAAAFYSITVPAGQSLTVTTRSSRSMQVRVSNGCDFADLRCLAFGSANTATYMNTTGSAQPVVISVTPDLGNIYSLAFDLDVDITP
ncbi:MAG: hypothetical protein U0353_10990 [Sandaracinus sp.]